MRKRLVSPVLILWHHLIGGIKWIQGIWTLRARDLQPDWLYDIFLYSWRLVIRYPWIKYVLYVFLSFQHSVGIRTNMNITYRQWDDLNCWKEIDIKDTIITLTTLEQYRAEPDGKWLYIFVPTTIYWQW